MMARADLGHPPDFNFTGQNQDAVSGTISNPNGGLYDFLFREYNPQHGRWISPDPAGRQAVSLANPQTWNRYAYVVNSPLTATDALGLDVSRIEAMEARTFDTSCVDWNCTTYAVNGMEVPANVAQSYLSLNAVSSIQSCSTGLCNQMRYDNETGGWEQITGWQTRTLLPSPGSGGSPYDALVPIWGDAPDPTLAANNGQDCDNACQLAKAINKTGVQALQNPCTPVAFYAGSAAAATGASVVSDGAVFPEITDAVVNLAIRYHLSPTPIQWLARQVGYAAVWLGSKTQSTCNALQP